MIAIMKAAATRTIQDNRSIFDFADAGKISRHLAVDGIAMQIAGKVHAQEHVILIILVHTHQLRYTPCLFSAGSRLNLLKHYLGKTSYTRFFRQEKNVLLHYDRKTHLFSSSLPSLAVHSHLLFQAILLAQFPRKPCLPGCPVT